VPPIVKTASEPKHIGEFDVKDETENVVLTTTVLLNDSILEQSLLVIEVTSNCWFTNTLGIVISIVPKAEITAVVGVSPFKE